MKKLFTLLWALAFLSCSDDAGPPTNVDFEALSNEVVNLVNAHRQTLDSLALEACESCSQQAQLHSEHMASGATAYGHDGFAARFKTLSDATGSSAMGENVAKGQTNATEVMEDWLNSKDHRDNIEGDFTHIGVGVSADDDGIIYFTQIFVRI